MTIDTINGIPAIDPVELEAGINHELEHTGDREKAREMAITHLKKIPDYYTRLARMEKEANVFSEENDADDPDDLEVEAFSVGKHTSENGDTNTYTIDDLNNIADKYEKNKGSNPAPVVIGHPEMDSPAYGWIKGAKVKADKLVLKLGELNKDFVDALKTGAYKTRSIAMYADGMIKHLGFLGAYKPAIKGLAPFSFKENNQTILIYNFTEENMADEKTVNDLQKKVAWYEKIFAWLKTSDNFAEPPVEKPAEIPSQPAVNFAEFEAMKAENEALKNTIAEIEKKKTEKPPEDMRAFCESLVKEGLLRPVDVDIEVQNLELRQTSDKVKQFAEGEISSVDKYKEVLRKRPKIVTFGETPNFPDKYAPVSVPTVDGMDKYIESKMEEREKEDNEFTKNYAEHLKSVYAEVSTEHPSVWAEYAKKQFGCGK